MDWMEVNMDSVINSIFCYGFHDTNINYIIINNDEITIYFDGGLYNALNYNALSTLISDISSGLISFIRGIV